MKDIFIGILIFVIILDVIFLIYNYKKDKEE